MSDLEPRSDRLWRRFAYGRAAVWVAMIPIAVLFGWVSSVVFVAACSLYANAASDFSAGRSDHNQALLERLARIEEKVDRLAEGRAVE